METTWRQNGDKMETKMETKMKTKLRENDDKMEAK
jgi:hypothetical protein